MIGLGRKTFHLVIYCSRDEYFIIWRSKLYRIFGEEIAVDRESGDEDKKL